MSENKIPLEAFDDPTIKSATVHTIEYEINEDNCVLTSQDMLLVNEAFRIVGGKEVNGVSFKPWCDELSLKIKKLNDLAKEKQCTNQNENG